MSDELFNYLSGGRNGWCERGSPTGRTDALQHWGTQEVGKCYFCCCINGVANQSVMKREVSDSFHNFTKAALSSGTFSKIQTWFQRLNEWYCNIRKAINDHSESFLSFHHGNISQKAKTETKLQYLFQPGWEIKVFNFFFFFFLYPGKMSFHANILHFHFDRNETNIIKKKKYAKCYSYGRRATCTISINYKHFSNLSNFPDKLSDNIISLMLVSVLVKGGRRKKRLLYFCVSFYA